ncbi:hypothetical protein A2422_00660 [Candidatus Woesebacteria bacterium RIFOXYC1_FULL_31_51]|nr:MAG: hypothetical protein A2375_00490 [Candidatus Woesebacteria bacterium RIFOXYB1_FULL_31_120]OGM82363.1 MAG: hypothetical protein A2422_00660 [Candidatus Woesebacteria bacterium RIFOXYC1_FULL_31_51]OGM86481.1 MAG: hypothetical protein A2595_01050 [Candidatus Woesebacteria bacterium RIFOXYD1_FULL_31_53]HBP39483.1 hypothetical protein [Candidatus Woesebacteria bacterium]
MYLKVILALELFICFSRLCFPCSLRALKYRYFEELKDHSHSEILHPKPINFKFSLVRERSENLITSFFLDL